MTANDKTWKEYADLDEAMRGISEEEDRSKVDPPIVDPKSVSPKPVSPKAKPEVYGDGKVYVVNLDRTLMQKAKDGYERMRRTHSPILRHAPRTPWESLVPSLQGTWMRRVREVEADPFSWLDATDDEKVAFAKGVLLLV